MEKKKYFIMAAVILIIILIFAGFFAIFFYPKYFSKKEVSSFEIGSLFLKVGVDGNEKTLNNVKVTNLASKEGRFNSVITGMDGFATIKNPDFDLNSQESYNLEIILDPNNLKPGVYLGKLEISSLDDGKKDIPVIFEVQSKEVLFDSNINLFPQGRDLISGESLVAQTKIFDLSNTGRRNIKLSYSVMDFAGNNYASDSETLVVDGKLDYSKTLALPSKINPGSYVLINSVQYQNSTGVSSVYFRISEKVNSKDNGIDKNLILIVVFFGFLFSVFLILFVYSLLCRDRLLIEIKNQYENQIKREKEIIRLKENRDLSTLRSSAERRIYKKAVNKIKRKRLELIKDIHKKRLKEYHRIKKHGKSSELKRQIESWKREGYNTKILEQKYKIPNVSDIKAQVNKWKKEGYSIDNSKKMSSSEKSKKFKREGYKI